MPKPKLLITGAAGFIGSHAMREALLRGYDVLGVDNLNAYYTPKLKEDRLAYVAKTGAYEFEKLDIADHDRLASVVERYKPDFILHLAAQAGVRYSLEKPFEYAKSNLVGHLSVLEAVRATPSVKHMVYASSSSVYGNSSTPPFSEEERVERPVSLYAATKRADELMSASYAHLYGMRATGLRFFTVYGPWGRPDMAYWIFAEAILKGERIKLFNSGDMQRDFTHIDNIVEYLFRIIESQPTQHSVYNIGGSACYDLKYFVDIIGKACGKDVLSDNFPMQPGDVYRTQADTSRLIADFGEANVKPIEAGLPEFVDWLKSYLFQ